MLSWLRTTAATEWFAGYLFNTQSQLICIIIAQPQHTVATVCVSKKQEVTGVDGGTKNNWRGRLLKYTDEFNEWTYKCNFCANEIFRKLTQKFNNLPRPLKVGLRHRKLIPKRLTYVEKILQTTHTTKRGRMWSFVNTDGSHSPPTKIKTHYSSRVQLQ